MSEALFVIFAAKPLKNNKENKHANQKKSEMEPNPFADESDDRNSDVESFIGDVALPELPGSPPDSDSDWSTDDESTDDDCNLPKGNGGVHITITSAKGATTTTSEATVNSNGQTTVTLVVKKTRTCHSFEYKLRVARKFIALQAKKSFDKLKEYLATPTAPTSIIPSPRS